MTTALWFSNLLFWSAQVALLALAAAFLPRLFQIRQPRVLLAYWRALLAICLMLPVIQPWHRLPGVAAIVIAPDVSAVRVLPSSSPRRLALAFSQPSTHRPNSRCRNSRGYRRTIRNPRDGTSETPPAPAIIFANHSIR